MERYTRPDLGESTSAVMCNHKESDCNDSCMYGTCKWNQQALLKLKEYEDTNHTPEQIKEFDKVYLEKCKEVNRLKEENRWIPVSERLPANEKEVEVSIERHCENKIYKFTCRAIHEDGTLTTDDSGYSWEDNDFLEYDEEKDSYLIPEGWWEQNRYCEEFGIIDDFVIAWKPLPEPYKEVEDAT